MTEKRSRRGAVELGTVLMVVAFAIIAGFIYWLSGQAANERAMEIVEDTTTEVVDNSANSGATQVSERQAERSDQARNQGDPGDCRTKPQ